MIEIEPGYLLDKGTDVSWRYRLNAFRNNQIKRDKVPVDVFRHEYSSTSSSLNTLQVKYIR